MFQVHVIDGNACPVIVCDICGERLTDVTKSALVYPSNYEEGTKMRGSHVHKFSTGRTNGKTCLDLAEELNRKNGHESGWLDMNGVLSDLLWNIGFPSKSLVAFEKNRKPRIGP